VGPGGVGVMMLKLLVELEEIQVRGIRHKDNKLSPLRPRIGLFIFIYMHVYTCIYIFI
jgi:hypothetical protein